MFRSLSHRIQYFFPLLHKKHLLGHKSFFITHFTTLLQDNLEHINSNKTLYIPRLHHVHTLHQTSFCLLFLSSAANIKFIHLFHFTHSPLSSRVRSVLLSLFFFESVWVHHWGTVSHSGSNKIINGECKNIWKVFWLCKFLSDLCLFCKVLSWFL